MKLRILVLVAALGAVVFTGCGPSCADVCNHTNDCVKQLGGAGWSADELKACTDQCEADTGCKEKGDALDCLNDLKCESQQQFLADFAACSTKCE